MRAMVMRQVRNAFKICGDLLVSVNLELKAATSYNMGDMLAVVPPAMPITIQGIFLNETKLKGAIAEIIFISEDVPDLSLYSTLTVNGKVWKVVEPIVDDTYLVRVGLN